MELWKNSSYRHGHRGHSSAVNDFRPRNDDEIVAVGRFAFLPFCQTSVLCFFLHCIINIQDRNQNMDPFDIAEIEDAIDDDASSSAGDKEDETDPSSMFSSDVDRAERDKRRKAFIEREEKHVRKVRRAVAVAVLTFAVVVSSSVFVLARNKEHETFTHEVCWYLAFALALLIDGLE
jgi:hypothetical protein